MIAGWSTNMPENTIEIEEFFRLLCGNPSETGKLPVRAIFVYGTTREIDSLFDMDTLFDLAESGISVASCRPITEGGPIDDAASIRGWMFPKGGLQGYCREPATKP